MLHKKNVPLDKENGPHPKGADQTTNTETTKSGKTKQPPSNTLFVERWTDLPDAEQPATYRVYSEANFREIKLQKKTRRVLEGLLNQPVACASRCRISDRVLLLRRDFGINIEMQLYKGDGKSECENFGVYFLKSRVERFVESEAA